MLSWYAGKPDEYKSLVTDQINRLKPEDLRYALQSPDSDESSYLIMLIEPSPTSRFLAQKRVISRGVFDLLWDRHVKDRVSNMQHFYDVFKSSPGSGSAAGWVFEIRIHQLLKQGISIRLFPISRRGSKSKVNEIYDDYTASKQRENQKVLQLTASEGHLLDEKVQLVAGHYYRPEPTNFPTIDSLSLIHPPGEPSPILLIFQISRGEEVHNVNEAGLCKIERMGLPQGTRRYYVLATPDDIYTQVKAPMVYPKEGQKTKKFSDVFEVFHWPVDTDQLFPPSHQ